MTACFRCHGQEPKAPAPGACDACHTPDFELRPPSHEATGAFVAKHGEIALEVDKEVKKTLQGDRSARSSPASARPSSQRRSARTAQGQRDARRDAPAGRRHQLVRHLPQGRSSALACHGTPMPHSAEFKEPKDVKDPKGHPVSLEAHPREVRHVPQRQGRPELLQRVPPRHEGRLRRTTPAKPWTQQHPKAVAKSGVKSCLEKCHASKFCVDCHTSKKVVPGVTQAGVLDAPADSDDDQVRLRAGLGDRAPLGGGQAVDRACEVCHGAGGIERAVLQGCHKLEMPHTKEFKQFHVEDRPPEPRRLPELPHVAPELCSNCHHVGSSTTVPWIKVHGSSVTKNGAGGCIEKCHKQADCAACHTAAQGRARSHKAKDFVKVPGADVGNHAALYKKDASVCTYCHPGDPDDLPNSTFCKGCHKVAMPHPAGFGMKDPQAPPSKENAGSHAAAITSGQVNRPTCLRCHEPAYCNACHHQGSVPTQPWVRYHPVVVKKSGAERVLRMPQGDVLLQLPREPCEAGPAQVAPLARQRDSEEPGRGGRAPSSSRRATAELDGALPATTTSLRCVTGRASIAPRRDVAQLGRALGSGPRGRGFESRHPDHPDTDGRPHQRPAVRLSRRRRASVLPALARLRTVPPASRALLLRRRDAGARLRA